MKELFRWYNKYSVNNEEIDKQHKALFDIFNRLYDFCGENNTKYDLRLLMSELVSYTKYHFSAEEQYMRSKGFINIDQHISEHKIFTDRIMQLHSKSLLNEHEISKELIVYLWDWIINHVMIEDKKIAF